MISTKIAAGLYRISHNGKWFHVEDVVQSSRGENKTPGWIVYEIRDGARIYLDDFPTKGHAMASLSRATSE